ncbi:MAG: rRNA maturation RNase YbeY [Lewinella sp.]|nr:rRNA maturation RNase YbeY [Lewinella sp.]
MDHPHDFPLPDEANELPGIDFAYEAVTLDLDEAATADWIQGVVEHHQGKLGQVQYVFCSDDYLHQINVEYLDHDTLTDIITFPYAEPPEVAGDIFISIDRVQDNARELGQSFDRELHRVIIHGILHLCGFSDKSPVEASRMRELEDEALALWLPNH